MAQGEIHSVAVGPGPARRAGRDTSPRADLPALAAVPVNATSPHWLLGDIFGEHPAGITQDRCVAAPAELAAKLLQDD
jgi:hypothetical protein